MAADEVCFNYWVQYAKEHDNHGAVDYNAEEEIKMLTGHIVMKSRLQSFHHNTLISH